MEPITKKLLFLALFLILLIAGIFLRLSYADWNYSDKEGKFISSNPDGMHWLSNAPDPETWQKYNPIPNKYFSFVCFIILLFLALLIINLKDPSLSMSILFIIFMLFSNMLYTRSSLGYYDHDFLGMIVFFGLILVFYLPFGYWLLAPIVIYFLQFVWDGLIPIAYLFCLIVFIEYSLQRKKPIWNMLKYLLYFIFAWIIILQTFSYDLYIKEIIFYPEQILILLPMFIIGIFLSQKRPYLRACIIFALLVLLHSGRTVIIAYPVLFLALCMLLKDVKLKIWVSVVLLILFALTQTGHYLQLARFGTPLTDEGMYYLRENSSNSSIVMAWWDYGYYIEYISYRQALYKGNPDNPGLKELSSFYCNGTMPNAVFDYFVRFSYDTEIMASILAFKGNSCPQDPYINHIGEDIKRFKLVFSNKDLQIYHKEA